MIKTVSRRVITNVAVRLRKVAITFVGSDAVFGTLTDMVFPFTCRCYNSNSLTSRERLDGSITPLEMENDKNS